MKDFRSSFDEIWLLVGDFNVTLSDDERKGKRSNDRDNVDFCNFVREMESIDPPLHGGKFTWTNKREIPSFAKLDRFLYSTLWNDKFPFFIQKGLFSQLSDYCPLYWIPHTLLCPEGLDLKNIGSLYLVLEILFLTFGIIVRLKRMLLSE